MARSAARTGRPRQVGRTRREASAPSSFASTPGVRSRMQTQRTRDTAPELALRRLLHAAGLRYRVDTPPLPGMRQRADVVFTRAKVAVFLHGCFWHACPLHGTQPKANAPWWTEKLARNVARDAQTRQRLEEAGWDVVTVWEHDDPHLAAVAVAKRVRQRQAATRSA